MKKTCIGVFLAVVLVVGVAAVSNPNPFMAGIKTVVDAIKVVTDSLPVLTETGSTVTTDGTEQNLYINNAPSGSFIPICLKLCCTNQTAAETNVVRTYYRIKSGGQLVKQAETTYGGVQDPGLIKIGLDPNRYGVSATISNSAGSAKAYDVEVFYEL